jgi:hypothetical protein
MFRAGLLLITRRHYCVFTAIGIMSCAYVDYPANSQSTETHGTNCCKYRVVHYVWNVMAHAQKPDFVFRRNGRVHLNRQGRQFSWVLAAEVCASAVVMLDTSCSEVVWEYWLPTPFASFPFTSPPVLHRVPSLFNWSLRPDDEQLACSKHVEVNYWNTLKVKSASCWFLLHGYITMHGQQNTKFIAVNTLPSVSIM